MTPTDELQRNSVSRHSRRAKYRIAALIWGAALLIGSLQPRRTANLHFGTAHDVAHFLGFGALAFFAAVGFGKPGRTPIWPAAAAFLLGFTIEFLQHWQNRMPVEWYDVRDNAVGILAFTAFYYLVDLAVRTPKRL